MTGFLDRQGEYLDSGEMYANLVVIIKDLCFKLLNYFINLKSYKMKKIWIVLLFCGMNIFSFSQLVDNYKIILNNDTSALNATVENRKAIFNFQKTDILTITFDDLKTDISKKSVKIISESNNEDILIGTFGKDDVKANNSYSLKISFEKLLDKLNKSVENNVYSIIVMDKNGKQNLLRFKLI